MHRKLTIRILLWACFISFSFAAYAQDSPKVYVSLTFIGDVMQHGPQIKSAYNPSTDLHDYYTCFRKISPSIRSSDIAIANLELTLAGRPFSGYPTFSAPDEIALDLKKAGVDILVTANNHSLDRRKKGLERTIQMLDSFDIQHTGTFIDSAERARTYPLVIEKKGIKLAILNYTYGTNGIPVTEPNIVNLIDTAQIHKDHLKALSMDVDAIITFVHWGYEYKSQPNNQQRSLAKMCKKWGSDMIIGSHPHVLQPSQIDDDGFLTVYSLGNFVSNQRNRYRDGGMMFNVLMEFDTVAHEHKIVESGYTLTWVYKKIVNQQPQYYVLPAVDYAHNEFISESDNKAKLKQFISDSRILFKKYNKGAISGHIQNLPPLSSYNIDKKKTRTYPINIPQYSYRIKEKAMVEPTVIKKEKTIVSKNKTTYRIQFLASAKKEDLSNLPVDLFPNIIKEKASEGFTRYFVGEFSSREKALDHLKKLREGSKYKDAFLVVAKID